jgi:hypothetical protein
MSTQRIQDIKSRQCHANAIYVTQENYIPRRLRAGFAIVRRNVFASARNEQSGASQPSSDGAGSQKDAQRARLQRSAIHRWAVRVTRCLAEPTIGDCHRCNLTSFLLFVATALARQRGEIAASALTGTCSSNGS